MWIYGGNFTLLTLDIWPEIPCLGMTDLQERGDLWKWDLYKKTWSNIKTKLNPGPLHSHSCCKLPSFMIIFGGERNGEVCNDLWKFNFGKFYA